MALEPKLSKIPMRWARELTLPPLLGGALGKAGPEPCLGCTVELVLLTERYCEPTQEREHGVWAEERCHHPPTHPRLPSPLTTFGRWEKWP